MIRRPPILESFELPLREDLLSLQKDDIIT